LFAALVGVGAAACDEPHPTGGGTTSTPSPTPTPTPSPTPTPTTGTIVIDNESSSTIWYLYVSASSSSDWGPDQLGSQVISPGHAYQLTDVPCNVGPFDLKVEDALHDELATHYGATVECGRTTTWTLY
jgi:hypothetical protein